MNHTDLVVEFNKRLDEHDCHASSEDGCTCMPMRDSLKTLVRALRPYAEKAKRDQIIEAGDKSLKNLKKANDNLKEVLSFYQTLYEN